MRPALALGSRSRGRAVAAAVSGSINAAAAGGAGSGQLQPACMYSTSLGSPLHFRARFAAAAPVLQGSVRFAHVQTKSWILRRNETQRTHKQRRDSHRTSDQLTADVEAFVSSPATDKSQAVDTAIELLSDILVNRFAKSNSQQRLTSMQLSLMARKIVEHCKTHELVISDAQSVRLFGVFLKSSESLATYLANSGIVQMGPTAVNTLISSYTVTENADLLKKTLGDALDRGIALRVSRFSKALYFLAAKDIEAAYELLQRSQSAGFSTYADLVAPIVWGLLNRKQDDFARKVLAAYLDSHTPYQQNVLESSSLTATFVATAVATYRTSDEYEKAKDLFVRLVPSPPYRAYPTLLTSMAGWAHEKKDLELAREIWKRMGKYGLLPPSACAKVLAVACMTRQLDFADQVYSEISRQLERKKMEMTGPLHAAFVEYYIHQDHYRKAVEVFLQMSNYGVQPRLDCCVPLIKLLGLKQRYSEIWQMYEFLSSHPSMHKAQLYEAMAKVMYYEQSPEKIQVLLRDMQTQLGRVDSKSYGILMGALAHSPAADPALVVSLYKNLLEVPKHPTRIHLDALRSAANRIGDPQLIAFAEGETKKHLRASP